MHDREAIDEHQKTTIYRISNRDLGMGSTLSPKTMRAGQWDPAQNRVVVNTIPTPSPGPNEILVKITSASLCHTDLMAISQPDLKKPFTMGHEGVGIIESFHPSTQNKGFQTGDAIGFLYILGCCFECEGCMVHNRLCLNGQPEMQGWAKPGFFAEYAVIDYRNAIHLPETWSLKTSSVFFCAGITGMLSVLCQDHRQDTPFCDDHEKASLTAFDFVAFHAIDSCELRPGQSIAVIGAGGLGQLAIQYAKAMDLQVIAIDINDETLKSTLSQGASHTFNSRSNPEYITQIKTLTQGGVHAAAVFSNAKSAYKNALEIIRYGGLLMVVGLPSEPLEVDTVDLAIGKYRIKAEATSIPQRMKKAVDFSVQHGITPQVQVRRLEELDDMVREMKEGRATGRMAVGF